MTHVIKVIVSLLCIGSLLACTSQQLQYSDQGQVVSRYTLVLAGFQEDALNDLESALTGFAGYQRHQLNYAREQRVEYWFEYALTRTELRYQLSNQLQKLGHSAAVDVEGRLFTVTNSLSSGSSKGSVKPPVPAGFHDW